MRQQQPNALYPLVAIREFGDAATREAPAIDPFLRQSDNSEATLTLRPLRSADVTFLTELWVASWQETMPEIDFEGRRGWLVDFLTAPGHDTLVADSDAGLLGFVTLEATHLHQLAVAPAAKGGGIAIRLLDAAKQAAPNGLTLDVNQANARAVRFYRREGFAIVAAGVNAGSGLPTWRMVWPAPSRAP